MTSPLDLVKAVRSGRLADVKAVLDAGVSVDLLDTPGDPGLPMGIACFMGFVDIVRELAGRGGKVNLPDNSLPTSPLSMALRGGRTEVVRTLIELGCQPPAGMNCGLTEQEVIVAKWKAQRAGHAGLATEASNDVEEIVVGRCFGTDTRVLEAEAMRGLREGG